MDIALTYLEIRVAQKRQNTIKVLEKEGKNPKERVHFKEALTKTYGNINSAQVACTKLSKLFEHSLVESYANKFHNLCAKFFTLSMSVGDNIHRFIHGFS